LHDDEITMASIGEDLRMTLSNDVVDVLANLHLAVPADIGLGDLSRTEGYVARQLKRWNRQWESSKTRELPAMEELYAALVSHAPEQRYTGVVHGDYRLGNMLVTPETGKVAAVLDWELCTLGDALADVGYLLNNWVLPGEEDIRGATAFPTKAGGFASREYLIERYEEKTGFEVGNIGYYQAFQFWRLAAIVEGVLSRYLQGVMGDSSDVDTDEYSEQVENLAAGALEIAKNF
jgi:aminoglycoside phosphotransferase (APT) family kinase protein